MKKSLCLFVSVLIILIIGGCGLMEKDVADMDPKDLPNVTAFQDDFTREFMASTEPVEEGYYTFESKTGGYTMKFPDDASIDKGYYERKKDTFERVSYAEEVDEDYVSYYVIATYDNFNKSQDVDDLLYLLSSSLKYKGEYEDFEHEDNTIYFASKENVTKDKMTTWFRFFGLIKSNRSNQSLRYIYSIKCEEPENKCSYDLDSIEQNVKDTMKSVEFTNIELEEE
ncbi:hypothetical protein KQI49_01570 [Virgibacillus sp. MSJ-26]|uniref:hypothetical protein n=1 Tax=Virgibacillus sp. MSJ-26 TaxID=2841522 RepID=UPI001C12037C|nr:hypothetical protein [Virgibacillus sp. MSJ-26]MBU5465516.1 hypothetical protein [Virgibacillus sp. MSJ-26]